MGLGIAQSRWRGRRGTADYSLRTGHRAISAVLAEVLAARGTDGRQPNRQPRLKKLSFPTPCSATATATATALPCPCRCPLLLLLLPSASTAAALCFYCCRPLLLLLLPSASTAAAPCFYCCRPLLLLLPPSASTAAALCFYCCRLPLCSSSALLLSPVLLCCHAPSSANTPTTYCLLHSALW